MKFDILVNSILNEEWTDDRKSLNIIDSYRGQKDVVARLVGDEKNSETVDGVNGDGSDEFRFSGVSFNSAVNYGTEIGLWKEDGEGNLVVLDSDKWDEFYSETVSVSDEEPVDYGNEYEHKGWPGDGSGEDDFADYNQMEGNDY